MNINDINDLNNLKFEKDLREGLDQEFSPSQATRDRIKSSLQGGKSQDTKQGLSDTIEKKTIKEDRVINMTRDKGFKTPSRRRTRGLIAASIAGLLLVSGIGIPVIGSEIFVTTDTLSTENGYVTVQVERPLVDLDQLIYHFPENLRGKIYDAQGRQIDEISYKDGKKAGIFDIDGNKISEIDEKNGTYILEKDSDKKLDKNLIKFQSLEAAKKHLAFSPRLPKDFKLVELSLFKDENGLPASDMADFVLEKNGAKIYVQERLAKKVNAYETGSSQARYVYFNGKKAILSENKNIDWEDDGLIISINSKTSTYYGHGLVELAASFK